MSFMFLHHSNDLAPEKVATSGFSSSGRSPPYRTRKLGALLLTRTMERRHQLGLDSYDRLFPNQDTMPKAASAT
jgi:hypothetical protein